MAIERFVVDAKLLRELGERLVGRPHIALAELIKNSYDADARNVETRFHGDTINVIDDGHGMSRADFVDKWMRIGTIHKERARHTPELKRPYTGSKGVGRLAAQVLAHAMTINTVGLRNVQLAGIERRSHAGRNQLHDEVVAEVDWDEAVAQDTLNQVDVSVEEQEPDSTFANGSACGTWITLERLATNWDANRFRRLAQQIWALQPPFALAADDERAFKITLKSDYGNVADEFDAQMRAILDIWAGRVTGKLVDKQPKQPETFTLTGRLDAADTSLADADPDEPIDANTRWLDLTVEQRGRRANSYVVRIPNCLLRELQFEVRIYDLHDRQDYGVKVGDAREWINEYGGISVFDEGFRLPYYGAEQDWLFIERDHARRLSNSLLPPEKLRVERALYDLPTNRRIFGSVSVSTARELQRAREEGRPTNEALTIQVTRDRLVSNDSYDQLRHLVRVGMDLYAGDVARRKAATALGRRANARPTERFRDVLDRIEDVRDDLPATTYKEIRSGVVAAIRDTEAIEQSNQAHTELLAALATAGMLSLAYDHDASKQIHEVLGVAKRLKRIARDVDEDPAARLTTEAERLGDWANRANQLRGMFRALADEEARESADVFNAKRLVADTARGVDVLRGKTTLNWDNVPDDLLLPRAGYAAWTALLQNILINALNATLDMPKSSNPTVDVDGGIDNGRGWLRIQDNGVGVDLDIAEQLFEPFVRGHVLDRRRAALGLGGSGLGLAIVRLIAADLKLKVAFEKPDEQHATSIVVRWSAPTTK